MKSRGDRLGHRAVVDIDERSHQGVLIHRPDKPPIEIQSHAQLPKKIGSPVFFCFLGGAGA